MKRDNENTGLGCLVAILCIPITAVLRGWVLRSLRGWFIVPTFGLPELSIPAALGMATLVGLLVLPSSAETEAEKKLSGTEKVLALAAKSFLIPLISLLIGWIIRGFMP